jgi:hypothetical protein
MGGERASTTRQRLSGKICCSCKCSLPKPHTSGEHLCARCTEDRKSRRRIYMSFVLSKRWSCQFLEEDLKTSLPRKLTLEDPAKLFEVAERGGYRMNLEGRQAIERAIETGRGGIWLELTEEQYRNLTKR